MKRDRAKVNKPTITYDHARVVPNEQISLHSQNTWEISYIIIGSGRRILGDKEEDFHAGEIVLVVPEMPHQWKFDFKDVDNHGKIENVTVCFKSNLLMQLAAIFPEYSDLANWYGALETSIKLKDNGVIGQQMMQMEQEQSEKRIATLLSILSEIRYDNEVEKVGHFPTSVNKVEEIKTWLRCNFQREVSLNHLAEYTGMNKSSMCTYFKRQTGETIISFLTKIRIDVAKNFLKDAKTSVAECCYRSGFNDTAHFSRVFKKVTGLSPLQYKQKMAG